MKQTQQHTAHVARRSWRAPIVGFLLATAVPAAFAGTIPPQLGSSLVQGYIAPAMQRFQGAAQRLERNLKAWCPAPSAQAAQTIEDDFAALVDAWSRIEFLRFGPLVAATRFERVYFWPDPRGITLRQVQGLVAQPEAIPGAKELGSHSVAIQGLPALEYVLYRDEGLLARDQSDAGKSNTPVPNDFAGACTYATSVAGNIALVGNELVQAWGPEGAYGRQFAAPSPDSALYRNQQEVAAEAIKAFSTGLQFARDVKLLPVLGKDFKQAKPKRAPFWRSGLSARAMAASVEGMLQFYRAGGYIYNEDEAWVDQSLQDELRRSLDNFASMQKPMQALTKDADGYRRLTLAALLLENTKSIVDEHVAPAFGVRIGFNALDGD